MKKQTTIARKILTTVLVLVGIVIILLLDYAVIQGARAGIRYIGDKIEDAAEYISNLGIPEDTEEETKLTEEELKQILEEEEEKLDRLRAEQ